MLVDHVHDGALYDHGDDDGDGDLDDDGGGDDGGDDEDDDVYVHQVKVK